MAKINSFIFFSLIIIGSLYLGYAVKKTSDSRASVKSNGIETSALITKITRKTVGETNLGARFFVDVRWQDKTGAELSHKSLDVFGQSLPHVKKIFSEVMSNRKAEKKGSGFHTEEVFFKNTPQTEVTDAQSIQIKYLDSENVFVVGSEKIFSNDIDWTPIIVGLLVGILGVLITLFVSVKAANRFFMAAVFLIVSWSIYNQYTKSIERKQTLKKYTRQHTPSQNNEEN